MLAVRVVKKGHGSKQSGEPGARLHRQGPGRLEGMQGALQSEGGLGTRGTLGVPLEGTLRVGGLLGVAGMQ